VLSKQLKAVTSLEKGDERSKESGKNRQTSMVESVKGSRGGVIVR